MGGQSIRYAVLRDQRIWDEGVSTAGLQPEPDGVLRLARVPGAAAGAPLAIPAPFAVEPSGLAAGACGDLYIADSAGGCVIRVDGICAERTRWPGAVGPVPSQLGSPRGLLALGDSLYVADSARGQVHVLSLPGLEPRAAWAGSLAEPIALAADSAGRIYVLDRRLARVLRFSQRGVPDEAYRAALPQLVSGAWAALALDGEDTLYIAADQAGRVLRFDPAGQALPPLPQTVGGSPGQPRAIVAHGDQLYIADAAGGAIWVFDWHTQTYLGTLADYRGPVAALAVDAAGTLFIKPGPGAAYVTLGADVACVALGSLTAGPFDAGEQAEWERAYAQVELPDGTGAELHIFCAAAPDQPPGAADWAAPGCRAAALDTLVASVPQAAALPPAGRRFLWLRVTLRSDDRRRASPRLAQVQAETVGESYMEYLPAVYRREDAQSHFLERWLALFRAELGDLERGLDEMAAHFDPHTAPEDHLRWLASWLAFDPPQDMQGDELRALFSNVRGLYERRGTLAGLGDFIELYIGVRPQIFEAFRERHIWQLGYTSALGCDTALAAGLPDGMIVPGQILADPRYQGLRGDYYNGIGFTQLRLSRVDPVIDFHWYPSSPDPAVQVDSFSVRWTGQVMPRYSERYTLYVSANDGVRLWVDGLLLINAWVDQSTTEYSATIELEAGRWYAIQIEYYEKGGAATIRLAWSSRSQLREIIPQSQLYAVHDEGAPTPSDQPVGGSETLIVGQTVVGQSGPLAGADYGMPLFSEGAHLFSVSLPASLLPAPGQREMLRRMIEAEKPAHTDYHLCFVEATMRVGIQAHIGIDSIVAGPPRPLELDGLALGQDTFLGDKEPAGSSGRIGKHARIGHDTRIG